MTATPRIRTESAEALADALVAEDHAEEVGFLDPLDRITCPTHRRWRAACREDPRDHRFLQHVHVARRVRHRAGRRP
jgi:hypothetical protein